MPRTLVSYESADPTISDVETPTCLFCGKTGWIQVPTATVELLLDGAFIQDAAPDLAIPLREQIISGVHPACSPF